MSASKSCCTGMSFSRKWGDSIANFLRAETEQCLAQFVRCEFGLALRPFRMWQRELGRRRVGLQPRPARCRAPSASSLLKHQTNNHSSPTMDENDGCESLSLFRRRYVQVVVSGAGPAVTAAPSTCGAMASSEHTPTASAQLGLRWTARDNAAQLECSNGVLRWQLLFPAELSSRVGGRRIPTAIATVEPVSRTMVISCCIRHS